MAPTWAIHDLVLCSLDDSWNMQRWSQLPADGNRYEVVDGVLYVTTVPDVLHQVLVSRVFLALHQQIDQQAIGCTLFAPLALFMPGCDPVQPDVVVVPAGDQAMIHERGIFGVPALLVEVLAARDMRLDIRIKRRAYARAGVPEYWTISPHRQQVFVYTQPDGQRGDYLHRSAFGLLDTLVSPTLPVHVAIEHLFDRLPGSLQRPFADEPA